MPDSTSRVGILRTAYKLEWITVGWLVIEAGVAIAAGVIAHSLLLMAFGLDSIIELASAAVLIWRLSVELGARMEISPALERRASRITGVLLLALSLYVVAASAWGLIRRQGAEFSPSGLAISLAAIPVMYILSRRKLVLAGKLGMPALRADAIESIACCWLALVVCVGLLAQVLSGAWWIDPVASLAIVCLLVKEGLAAWRDESDEHP